MPKFLTEDEVRDNAKKILGFDSIEQNIQQGTGQLTTFNQLGITGVNDKPDGWYMPDNKNDVAILLETKTAMKILAQKNVLMKSKKIVLFL